MALEQAEYILELKKGNPTRDDPISDGDNHIRMIKEVLLNTFPEADQPQAPIAYPQLEQGSIVHHVDGKWMETDSVNIDTSGNIQCANLNASGNVMSQSDERLKEKHSTIDDDDATTTYPTVGHHHQSPLNHAYASLPRPVLIYRHLLHVDDWHTNSLCKSFCCNMPSSYIS